VRLVTESHPDVERADAHSRRIGSRRNLAVGAGEVRVFIDELGVALL
jgi:hypothetical protein